MGSCAEPASTSVKKEKTGASGRSQIKRVRPLGSFLTVTRFSNEATSWASANAERRRKRQVIFKVRCFIEPPAAGRTSSTTPRLDEPAGQKFESTWADRTLSNDPPGFKRRFKNNAVFCAPFSFRHNVRAEIM